MKTILSALVALSVIAGVAGTANALDAKTFYRAGRPRSQLTKSSLRLAKEARKRRRAS